MHIAAISTELPESEIQRALRFLHRPDRNTVGIDHSSFKAGVSQQVLNHTDTNRAVFRNLPHNTVAIGRIRKDAKLFHAPAEEAAPRRGRRRWYGSPLPTPEQIRQDDSIPWSTITAFAAGMTHSFEVKTYCTSPLAWQRSHRCPPGCHSSLGVQT